MKPDYIGSVPDAQKYPDDNEPKEEIQDYDNQKEVDEEFDKMNQVEKDLCELGNETERVIYQEGYYQARIDLINILQDLNLFKYYIKISDRFDEILEKVKGRNYLERS